MAAQLSSVLDNTDKVIEYIGECQKMGIKVAGPDVNASESGFIWENNAVRFGLLAVKNIGRGLINDIIAGRESGGKYINFTDLCRRVFGRELNKRTLEALIKSGALDSLGSNRRSMLSGYENLLSNIDAEKKRNLSGQMSLFGGMDDSPNREESLPNLPDFTLRERLNMEKETTGLYLSGHPMNEYTAAIEKMKASTVLEIKHMAASEDNNDKRVRLCGMVLGKKTKTTKNSDIMAFVTLEDTTGSIEALVFPRVLSSFGGLINLNEAVVLEARISVKEDEEPTLIAERFLSIADAERFPFNPNAGFGGDYRKKPQPPRSNGNYAAHSQAEQAPQARPQQSGGLYGLFINVPSENSAEYKKAMRFLAVFDGLTPLYIHFADSKKTVKAPTKLWVDTSSGNNYVASKLCDILGEENVKMK